MSLHAAGILLTHDNRALFLKRSDKSRDHAGEWCCPGGSIESGETPEQAAARELTEETGMVSGDLTRIDEGDGFVTFRQNVDAETDPTLNDEHTEFRWAPLTTPPTPLHPGVQATLNKLLATAGAQDKREYDQNNWYEVLDNPLSKVGVYQYSEASIRKGGDRNKMVGVYRPPEELGSPECVNSIRLMPWTDDHPSDLLGDPEQGYVATDEKGVHGVIGEKTYFAGDTLYGNLKVFSQSQLRKINGGKKELSLGYHCDFVKEDGVFDGVPYQYVQRNIRGNHVASVKYGRMGSDVRVQDAAEPLAFAFDMKEVAMAGKDEWSDEARAAAAEARKKGGGSEEGESKKAHPFVASFTKEHGTGAKAKEYLETAPKEKLHTALRLIDKSGSDDPDSQKLKKMLEKELDDRGGRGDAAEDSFELATKVAGKVAAEKGLTGHDSTEVHVMAKDAKGDVKDPVKEDDKPSDLANPGSKDSMSEEEESGMDATEAARDAAEEEKEKDDDTQEAKDRRRARDKRAGARDARASARDKRAKDAKAAKDTDKDGDKKGMDAAAVTALVRKEMAAGGKALDADEIVALAISRVGPAIRKEEAAKSSLYGRISPIVGAFDHAEMTHAEMAAYGLDKLGAPKASDPVMALDYLLVGRGNAQPQQRASAQDAADSSYIDAYIGHA